ncbi:Putative Zn-dependent protease, contains TPR repeats [Syntrophus gentianae]|uniref:Putative Zn-dependent protease, contains TPR repeats n=1 Tax=Syntrophus gentianae TaxID=43775 RepID=A0A1H7XKW4_9BACT|nr:M48 family metallopeptidase [Syntrophus gentianae]SEM34274.1 Putative Zn-dependent protease, contains TPR repeats [Syntrophus gentianae]
MPHVVPSLKIAFIALFVVLFLFLSSYGAQASFTLEDEKKLGKEFYEKLEKSKVLISNPKINNYLNRVGQLVLASSPKAPFEFKFSVINSSAINAFATPGGYVYVNKGLINLCENESELAGVLAHEIAHINARHIAAIIEKSTKLNIAALAAILAGAFLGGGGEVTAALASFSMAAVTSMNLKYSRDHEEEADRLGMAYLVSSGYDGKSMLDFLKIMRKYEFYSKSVPSYFLTHPGTDERIRYLDGLLQVRYRNIGKESIIGGLTRIQVYLRFIGKNPELKLTYFQNSVQANPSNVDALYGLALTQEKLGLTSESIKNFKKALTLSPSDGDIVRDLGITCFRSGQTGEAIHYLSRALSLNPDDSNTIVYLGRAYQAEGRFQEALKILKKIENKPSIEADAHYQLAMAYGETKDQGASHYHFGMYFKKIRKKDSALFHFKAALNYYAAGNPKRQDIEKEIEEMQKEKPPKPPSPGDRNATAGFSF